ncbi:MAG: UvrB/UvrC motif-containing protein [Vallitalea sp.]|jgi:protein arginine kinase activator|nr:UvrB/UvrC motif-containing protein [Vallitalea sp.]
MVCERCHKEHATVYLNKIIDGKKQEIHLCGKCAMEVKGLYLEENISFQSFLTGLLGINNKKVSSGNIYNKDDILKCEKCNMTYSEFQKTGKFGCSNCYDAFSKLLSPVIRRVHGSNIHTGKIPNRSGEKIKIEKQIEELQNKLQKAVANEEYEEAAKFRDAIRELKKVGGIC